MNPLGYFVRALCTSHPWLGKAEPNDHVEGFITPADKKRARVGWIAPRIHREEEMVDARSDPPYGPLET